MANVFKARVQETAVVTGTGSVSLAGTASQGYQNFSGIATGSTLSYLIYDTVAFAWETGIGVYTVGTAPAGTLTRGFQESSTGALVSFAGNSCQISLVVLSPVTASAGAGAAGLIPALNANGQTDPTFVPLDGITVATNTSGLIGEVIPPTPGITMGQILINLELPVRVKIGYLGDSTAVGVYGDSVNGNTLVDKTKSVSYFLAQNLIQFGLNATNDSTFGTGNETNADPRFTTTGGFASSGAASVGGPCYQANAAGTCVFTAGGAFNAIDIYYIDAAAATFTMSVNGGASLGTTTITGSSGNVIGVTVSCTLTTGYVTLSWASGTIYFVGFALHNTTAPALEIYNFGSGGATSSGYVGPATATSGYGPLSGALATGITTLFYEIGVNDANNGSTTAAQYYANVLSTCQACATAGVNVVLIMPHPFTGSNCTTYFPGYLTGLRQIAAANKYFLIDFFTRYQPTATWNASTIMATSLHPDYACYQDKANYIANQLFQGNLKAAIPPNGGKVFLSSGSGVIPVTAKSFRVLGIGGGQSGAGGASASLSAAGSGGASGGTGSKIDTGWLPTSLLSTLVFSVSVGAGGASAAAGAAGNMGSNSTVTFGSFVITAYGANSTTPTPGASGAASVSGYGGGSVYRSANLGQVVGFGWTATSGALSSAAGAAAAATSTANGPSPGGAGGGLSAASTAVVGGSGGIAYCNGIASTAATAGATAGGAGGAAPINANWPIGVDGSGGGGGGGNGSGKGGNGGAGSQPGGSGGGGGSGSTGGGTGGAGGAGAVFVEWQ